MASGVVVERLPEFPNCVRSTIELGFAGAAVRAALTATFVLAGERVVRCVR